MQLSFTFTHEPSAVTLRQSAMLQDSLQWVNYCFYQPGTCSAGTKIALRSRVCLFVSLSVRPHSPHAPNYVIILLYIATSAVAKVRQASLVLSCHRREKVVGINDTSILTSSCS